jgi:hypothetical protein
MNGLVLSVVLLGSVSIRGGLLELAVLCRNYSGCGWSCSRGVMSFLVSCCGRNILLFETCRGPNVLIVKTLYCNTMRLLVNS